MVYTPLKFYVKIQIRALDFQNGRVRTSENLLRKSIEYTGTPININFFRTLEIS